MEFEDQEIIDEFVVESVEHLSHIESQLLAIEAAGADIDLNLVNTVFRGVHSIKGAAGFLGLTTINRLAHSLENVLNLVRERKLTPTSAMVDIMLRAADQLNGLLHSVADSNQVNVDELVAQLESMASSSLAPPCPFESLKVATAEAAEQVTLPELPPAPPAPKPSVHRDSNSNFEQQRSCHALGSETSQESSQLMKPAAETNIRVSVESLDRLMNLAGELVLGRNRLLQTVRASDRTGMDAVAAKINQVTCELQDAIMKTRMQPMGNVFCRFTRVVRDLSAKLGKHCELVIEGKEVEVDKTIIEAIADPLTHLVRNAIDHGMELPNIRVASGKRSQGTLLLRAFHQSGKVCIEIKDDGAGINVDIVKAKAVAKGVVTADQAEQMHDRDAFRLIFMPGFSTAETVTEISGRGVGMDVVRANIERLGGTVEIDSKLGQGTNFQVTLPLTLAIIPSLIVRCGDDRFAIPQVNIVELVRIRASETSTRIGRVKDAQVLRLRESLLPLVRLHDALEIPRTNSIRSSSPLDETLNIIVVETGQQRFGLIVDSLFDSEEIVVKPLGQHLKDCRCLSGATILGDGRVALIVDVSGISQHVELGPANDLTRADGSLGPELHQNADTQTLLLFSVSPQEQFAIPMGVVARIERVHANQIRKLGKQQLLQYQDTSLALICLEDCISAKPRQACDRLHVIVFEVMGRQLGLLAPILHDVRSVTAFMDDRTLREPGVIGSFVIDHQTTRLLDVFELVQVAYPEWTAKIELTESNDAKTVIRNRILLVEDSNFFRNQVKKHLSQSGYDITEAEDGQKAWDIVSAEPGNFDLVVTDIQMPHMNGFELCANIKGGPRTSHLPVIALTSLTGDEDIRKGDEVGVDDYQVKLDREKLLAAVRRLILPDHQASSFGATIALPDPSSPCMPAFN